MHKLIIIIINLYLLQRFVKTEKKTIYFFYLIVIYDIISGLRYFLIISAKRLIKYFKNCFLLTVLRNLKNTEHRLDERSRYRKIPFWTFKDDILDILTETNVRTYYV